MNFFVTLQFPAGTRLFFFFKASTLVLVPTQVPALWISAVISPVAKWPGHVADHSPPTSRLRMSGAAHPFMPHRNNFT